MTLRPRQDRVVVRIDWRGILAGAAVALVGLVATMVLVAAVDATIGLPHGSNWVFVFYGLALASLAAGGWMAARRRLDAPLLHGLLAALAGYAVVAIFGVVSRVTLDKGPDAVAVAFNALMAASAGIVGTLVAERGATQP
jgi:putative membrane protein (TIGR04086 family)